MTPATPTGREALERVLAETRKRGYALSIEERRAGGVGVAAPVFAPSRRVIASVGLALPTQRFEPSSAPRLAALGYYALGPDAAALAQGYLSDYYAFAGEYAAMVVSGALTSEAAIREQVAAFADGGCDELILFPCSPELDQLRRLADVTLG